MNEDRNKTLAEMNEVIRRVGDARVKEKKGGKVRFLLHLTPSMRETPIDALDLSVRGYHCLKRAGYNTIGQLVESIEEGNELSRIRNCGKNTIQEIMIRLFLHQYHTLSENRREKYLLETVALNRYVA